MRNPTGSVSAGLSPRVRGNRCKDGDDADDGGSIPACAGEPSCSPFGFSSTTVYPRVCGGTCYVAAQLVPGAGLSPRVRGNHPVADRHHYPDRSIPACAGEPRKMKTPAKAAKVYPRVCGGTPRCGGRAPRMPGLSPRVRGNHAFVQVDIPQQGSIPACAGEPIFLQIPQGDGRVYPRVCGGTGECRILILGGEGLSPRVRGNPVFQALQNGGNRSIPACAGEPLFTAGPPYPGPVYPRVCGGTGLMATVAVVMSGLSPRVRGNLGEAVNRASLDWSIPACAGEPFVSGGRLHNARVYPRVCGGTGNPGGRYRAVIGLSPRVRGNHMARRGKGTLRRSIPACAGEPT